MRHEKLAPESVVRAYVTVLQKAILSVRMRIRYGETIAMQELHDLTDALENIPQMLCAYGGWHVEENMDWALRRFDEKWGDASELSVRLWGALERARRELADLGPADS